jgi:hypothetical protein
MTDTQQAPGLPITAIETYPDGSKAVIVLRHADHCEKMVQRGRAVCTCHPDRPQQKAFTPKAASEAILDVVMDVNSRDAGEQLLILSGTLKRGDFPGAAASVDGILRMWDAKTISSGRTVSQLLNVVAVKVLEGETR